MPALTTPQGPDRDAQTRARRELVLAQGRSRREGLALAGLARRGGHGVPDPGSLRLLPQPRSLTAACRHYRCCPHAPNLPRGARHEVTGTNARDSAVPGDTAQASMSRPAAALGQRSLSKGPVTSPCRVRTQF